MVGVLVLVDEHVAEPAPVVLGHVGEGLQDVDGRHDEVVEVERVGLAQPPLVAGVGLGEHPLLVGALDHLGRERLLVDELVLEVADLVAEGPRRVALGVEVEVAHHHGHQALAVGGVVDRERGLEPDLAGLAAQDAHARGVERHDPHRLGPGPDERRDALAHLGGGLVGEGDREDLARLHAAGGEEVGDAVGEHARLARPGSRDDEQRAALVEDGLALLGVQPLQQRLGIGALTAPLVGAAAPARQPGPRWARRARRRRSRGQPQPTAAGRARGRRGRRTACSYRLQPTWPG